MRANIALVAIGLQVGEIHQHQTIHAVVEIRVAAEIDKLHAARDLLVAFYRMWFPATHPLAESRRPYPASLPDVLAQFGGED
ncbi:hypothetical protein GJD67_28405, partial [Klebsiella pneumoniae]|nr:hypothetical protein [Klebsiella pneumoniae]